MSTICFLTRLTRPAPPNALGQPQRQLTLGDTVYLLPEHAVDQVDELLVRNLRGGFEPSFLLVRASQYGLPGVVQRILNTAPRTGENDARALQLAAANGFADVVRLLLGAGVPAHREAAAAAAKADNPSCLALLLDALDTRRVVLKEAALAGSVGALRVLKPLVSAEEWIQECTQAFLAVARSGRVDVAQRLVTVAQPPRAAVSLALRHGNEGVVRVLQNEFVAVTAALVALKKVAPGMYATADLLKLIIAPVSGFAVEPEAVFEAEFLGHVGALRALLLHVPVPSPPPDPVRLRLDAVVQDAVRRTQVELPGTALRRAVTTFCHAAFERRMGVLLSFQRASGARHAVGLTARGMLWSQVHDGVSNIPASELFDHIAEGNSYELGALIRGAPPLSASHFWSALETGCQVMDRQFASGSRYIIRGPGYAFVQVGTLTAVERALAFFGNFEGREFAEDWRPNPVDWYFGDGVDTREGRRHFCFSINACNERDTAKVCDAISRDANFLEIVQENWDLRSSEEVDEEEDEAGAEE